MKTSTSSCLLITLVVAAISCVKTEQPQAIKPDIQSVICEVKNPIEDLLWLKQLKDSLVDIDIYTVPYKSSTVIWVYSGTFSHYPVLFSCNGQRVYLPDNRATDADAVQLLKFIETKEVCKNRIWSPPYSKRCQ